MLKTVIQTFAAACALTLLGGCAGLDPHPTDSASATYQSATAPVIECMPDAITITDLDRHGGFSHARDWTATCKDRHYFCTGVNDGYGGTTDVKCMKKPSN